MNSLLILTIIAVIIQFLTERTKILIPENYRTGLTPFVAMGIGISVAYTTQIGLFSILGIQMFPERIDYFYTEKRRTARTEQPQGCGAGKVFECSLQSKQGKTLF